MEEKIISGKNKGWVEVDSLSPLKNGNPKGVNLPISKLHFSSSEFTCK